MGAGKTEVDSRTIKPKVKNFDKNMRITGIPGYNMFGAPGAKSTLPNNFGKGKGINGENDSGPSLVARGNKWLNENIIRKLDVPAPDLPQLNLPKVNLPKVNLPKVNLPEVNCPKFSYRNCPNCPSLVRVRDLRKPEGDQQTKFFQTFSQK